MPQHISKLFEELFPSRSASFAPFGTYDKRERIAHAGQANIFAWTAELDADVLLIRAASWRQPENMFEKYGFVIAFAEFREHYNMASRKPTEKRTESDRAEWKGFLPLRLDEQQLSELDEWKPSAVDIWAAVDALIEGGYRLTLSYSKETKLASVTLINNNERGETAGYALSSADTDGAMALKMALYKHFTILQGDWSSLVEKRSKPQRG